MKEGQFSIYAQLKEKIDEAVNQHAHMFREALVVNMFRDKMLEVYQADGSGDQSVRITTEFQLKYKELQDAKREERNRIINKISDYTKGFNVEYDGSKPIPETFLDFLEGLR